MFDMIFKMLFYSFTGSPVARNVQDMILGLRRDLVLIYKSNSLGAWNVSHMILNQAYSRILLYFRFTADLEFGMFLRPFRKLNL